jgi:hypothetical protein
LLLASASVRDPRFGRRDDRQMDECRTAGGAESSRRSAGQTAEGGLVHLKIQTTNEGEMPLRMA